MRTAFGDTYFYLAVLARNKADRNRALQVSGAFGTKVVTTGWILTEVADALALPMHRKLFIQFLRLLRSDGKTTIIEPSEPLFSKGLDLYCARLDKAWSLTDCISFAVMGDMGITDALTADHHFEQAGFTALLK